MNITKSILILGVILLFQFANANEIGLDQKVSLQFEEIPVTTVLNMISEKYDLNIVQSSQIERLAF